MKHARIKSFFMTYARTYKPYLIVQPIFAAICKGINLLLTVKKINLLLELVT